MESSSKISNWSEIESKPIAEYLRWNSYRSQRHKLLYVATPKVACTTLKWWFAALEGYAGKLRRLTECSESDQDLIVHESHRVAKDVNGLPLADLAEALESESFFRFALVRNPYKRIFSAWQSKLLLQEPIQSIPYVGCNFFHYPIKTSADIQIAFQLFLEHLLANEAPSYWDHHWRPQTDLLRPDLINYTKIYKIEDAKAVNLDLLAWLGPYVPPPFQGQSSNVSLIPYRSHFLTERSEELIRALYAKDFDQFGYDRQPPAAHEAVPSSQLEIALQAVELIRGRHQMLSERAAKIIHLNQSLEEQSQRSAEAHQLLTESNQQLSEAQEKLVEAQKELAEAQKEFAEAQKELVDVNHQLMEAGQRLAERDHQIQVLGERIDDLLQSRSWRLTRPLRFLFRSIDSVRKPQIGPRLHSLQQTIKPARVADRILPSARLKAEVEAIEESGLFDVNYYLAMYPDIQPPPADPVRHYCESGWREGRNPSDDFDTLGYLQVYSDIRNAGLNPFWHYVTAGASESRQATPSFDPGYEEDVYFGEINSDIRIVAYFTNPDWSDLKRVLSVKQGSYQVPSPHEDFGFYDSSDPAILVQQAKLATRHGISTWCFKLVPEDSTREDNALTTFLLNRDVDISFVLELDFVSPSEQLPNEAVTILLSALKDERYMHFDGHPVLIMNRLEDADATTAALDFLEALFSSNNIYSPHLIHRCDRLSLVDNIQAGSCASQAILFDFPTALAKGKPVPVQPFQRNGISYVPYSVVVAQAIAAIDSGTPQEGPIYWMLTPGYDDSSVNVDAPLRFSRPTIRQYRRWLDQALADLRINHPSNRRLLFLSSWNDWNRGTVLEPDCASGYSRLNEISRALLGRPSSLAMPKVSIVVPNYNHASYLPQRLESIYKQTYPNIEVLLLDDSSTDSSREILRDYADRYPEVTATYLNQTNSGGVFRQWAKGIQLATGDLIWIAESDDYCADNFLETLVRCFDDEAVMLAYAQSEFVRADGSVIPNEFPVYVRDLACRQKWNSSYVKTAHQEVSESLGIINTIPNASGVVFRRPVEMPLLEDETWLSMRVVGDWVFYLNQLRGGKIAYSTDTTNYFRRYEGSAAETNYQKEAFFRELTYASQVVHHLFDVPNSVIEQTKLKFKEYYDRHVGGDQSTFLEWFDVQSILSASSSRTPNIIVSTQGFYPGGAEILPIRMANEFKRQGHAVTLLSGGHGQSEYGVRKMLRRDVPVVETSDVEETRKLLHDLGIEVLNSHQWHVQKYPTVVRDVFHGLKAHLASLHGMLEYGDAFGVTSEQLIIADQNVSTWIYTADKNLAPFSQHGIYQSNPSRFVKLPNGMEIPSIKPVSRSDMGIPVNAFVLCCVSRAIPEKGWEEAIEAVANAREITGMDIRLILVGNGPVFDEYCSKGVPTFVYLAGFNENSVGFYAASDVGIMLTKFKSESFPLTIVDCLFSGRPFIATSVGEIRNMLTTSTGLAGEVLELNDWEIPVMEVAQVIAAFATNPSLYSSAAVKTAEAANRYKIDTVVKQYIEIMNRDIADGSLPR